MGDISEAISNDKQLFAKSELEIANRAAKAEREIEIAGEVYEAAWRCAGASLDHYIHSWEDMFRDRGVGEIGLWNQLCVLRREMDGLEDEVAGLSTRVMSLSRSPYVL
jgi:hypothetical protein